MDATDKLDSPGGFMEVVFNPAGDRIVALVDGGREIVSWTWPESELESVHVMPQDHRAYSITFSNDGFWIGVALRDQIDILEFSSWRTLASLPVQGAFASSIRINPDRTRLFAGGGRRCGADLGPAQQATGRNPLCAYRGNPRSRYFRGRHDPRHRGGRCRRPGVASPIQSRDRAHELIASVQRGIFMKSSILPRVEAPLTFLLSAQF